MSWHPPKLKHSIGILKETRALLAVQFPHICYLVKSRRILQDTPIISSRKTLTCTLPETYPLDHTNLILSNAPVYINELINEHTFHPFPSLMKSVLSFRTPLFELTISSDSVPPETCDFVWVADRVRVVSLSSSHRSRIIQSLHARDCVMAQGWKMIKCSIF